MRDTIGIVENDQKRLKVGHFFLAINIESFIGVDSFEETAGSIMKDLRESPKEPGAERIYTAGEKEYLKEEEMSELSHRLSQRVAGLLRFCNRSPLDVFDDLRRAYRVRSKYIHGSRLKSKDRGQVAGLAERVLEHARVSLLAFLQIKSKMDKGELIDMIDQSLLDKNAYTKLRETVSESCRLYL